MPLSKRHDYIQVVLETVDHLRHHQIAGLVILQRNRKQKCVRWMFSVLSPRVSYGAEREQKQAKRF